MTEEPQYIGEVDSAHQLPEQAPPRETAPPKEAQPEEEAPASPSSKHKAREIKSTRADLKVVIVGSDGGDEIRWYQSATMAEHSNYIDNKIETLIEEKTEKPFEIRFPNIDTDTWDLMMKFLDPVESRDMECKDVLIVGEYYDEFDFPQGRKLCDKVLQEYFLAEQAREEDMNVEMLVDAVALAYKAHLLNAYAIGNKFIKQKLVQYKDRMVKKQQQQQLVAVQEDDVSESPTTTSTKSNRRSFGRR